MNQLIAALLLATPLVMAQRTREVIRHDNVTIDLIAEGRGPLLVLLPSLGRDSEEFDPVAEQLAAGGLRVLRPQPRGYGRSTGPMKNITLHDYARDVAAVIEHENAGSAILAGHAFGHFVAKMTAVDYPKLTRAVILIGAAQKTPDPAVQRAVAVASDPSQPEPARLDALKKVFFAKGNDARIWLTGFHSSVRDAEVIARDSTPQKEYYAGGTVPLLDIQGAEDPYKPPASSTELVDEFGAKRVTVVRIEHAAHAIIIEQPRAVSDAILDWVRRLPK
ncbi:MAG TPA: alpha/beta hydrolase [Bryobacteraceae bacterium]